MKVLLTAGLALGLAAGALAQSRPQPVPPGQGDSAEDRVESGRLPRPGIDPAGGGASGTMTAPRPDDRMGPGRPGVERINPSRGDNNQPQR